MTEEEKREISMEFVGCAYVHACQKHPDFSGGSIERAFVILGEEVGEVGKAILENDKVGLETELAQVAAVCLRFLELSFEK